MFARILALELRLSGGGSERLFAFIKSRGLRGQAIEVVDTARSDQPMSVAARRSVSDVLSEALVNANNPSKLLEIVALNKSSLSGTHALAALGKLSQLNRSTISNDQRKLSSSAAIANINDEIHRTLLSTLCGRILRTSRHLNPVQIVDAVKHLIALGVSPRSVVFQTVLQHLRTYMNDLRVKHLVFLDFLLQKVTRNAETSNGLLLAIREAIPLVVRNNLRMQINDDDVHELLQLLEFCTKHRFHWKDLQLVTNALESHCPLSLQASMSVLFVISLYVQNDNANASAAVVDPVKQSAVNVACLNLYRIEASDLLALVCRLAKRGHYVESLFTACGTRVFRTSKEWDLKSVSHLMSAFTFARHVNMTMLDEYGYCLSSVGAGCIETISADEIVAPFAVANYKTPLVCSILNRWCSLQSPLQWDENVSETFRLLVQLEIVGCSRSNFELPSRIKDVTSLLDFVRNHEAEDARSMLRDGLLLLQLKRLRTYADPSSPPFNEDNERFASTIGEILNETLEEVTPALKIGTLLRRALGSDYVIRDSLLSARTGIHFDHFIVPRSHWEAVGYTQDDQFDPGDMVPFALDNPHPNNENATVVLLVRGPTDYAANAPRLLGRPSLEADVLSRIGHGVVQISLEQWNEMPEHEWVPYLRASVEKATIVQ